MFRKDRIKLGGGIMFYVNQNNPCSILNADDYLGQSFQEWAK